MRVCGSKMLTIRTAFAVKQCSVTLALNLPTKKIRWDRVILAQNEQQHHMEMFAVL